MGQNKADEIFLTIKRKMKCLLPIRLASAVNDAGAGEGVGTPELSQEMACSGGVAAIFLEGSWAMCVNHPPSHSL